VAREENYDRRVYKQTYVRSLFDSIAHRYDLLNHILSSGLDVIWRRKAVNFLELLRPKSILDVACGTGDLAIEAARLSPERVIGIDISQKMLEIGRKKIMKRDLQHIITLEEGKAEQIRFEPNSFDVVMSSFGVRNFQDLEQGLKEFLRVLRVGGTAMILEFSSPQNFPFKQLYRIYSKYFLPLIGGFISRNRQAYEYLPDTISDFPWGDDFCVLLRSCGFATVRYYPLTFGIATVYLATKE
jgi:demethylmenaquinone methyltransferase / 2-methoxy-6-polyprenyl-1,4-benzoquinol methylase